MTEYPQSPSTKIRLLRLAALLVLPAVALLLAIMMRDARGPWWLGLNSD